jgi:hypothetical protein
MNQIAIPTGISQSVSALKSIFTVMNSPSVFPFSRAANGLARERPVVPEDAYLCKEGVGDL